MDDTTVFSGSQAAGGGRGGSGGVAASDRRSVRGQHELRDQADAALQADRLGPDRYGGWKRSTLEVHAERVRALIAAEPDITLAELRTRLAAEGAKVSPAALNRFLVAER